MNTLLNYFAKQYNSTKMGDITWAHAVNSKQKLARFLRDPSTLFIESDICMAENGEVIAAHPPGRESDLTLPELLVHMQTTKQGLKLDFKDPEAVGFSLAMLQKIPLTQPIILNADIVRGPGGDHPKINAKEFIEMCREHYPTGILSLGWTVGSNTKDAYSRQNIDDMLSICEDISDITFPIKASLLRVSWGELSRLIVRDGYSLSIWNKEPVDKTLQEWIKTNTDPQKTMYDLTYDDKSPLRLW